MVKPKNTIMRLQANLNDYLADFSDGAQESQLTSYPYVASYWQTQSNWIAGP